MPQDDLDHIPAFAATRDTALPSDRPRKRATKATAGKKGSQRPPRQGAGVWAVLFIIVALAAGGVACAWVWQLQQQLEVSSQQMKRYAKRIAKLEDRLSDTDEGVSQNAVVQAAKIRELDSEVRKLWDNVWKSADKRLIKLEADSKGQGTKVLKAEKELAAARTQLDAAAKEIAKLKSVSGDLERLMASARANQEEVEKVADTMNQVNLEFAKLGKRVESNEEWIGSINAFRRQINSTITELQATIRGLHAGPQG